MTQFGRVAVLMGGNSAERAISLESGQAVLDSMRRLGVDARAVDWQGEFPGDITLDNYDRVFVALHGRGGEDGQVQGLLDTLGMPYTGSGVLGCALAMDKARTKRLWIGMGLPTPRFVEALVEPDPAAVVADLGLPLMVKPSHEGSSLGAAKVEREADLPDAWRQARTYDDAVIIEQWIEGAEYTVSILHGQALPIIRLKTARAFYDYEAKYQDDRTQYLCPCGLEPAQEKAYQRLALQAFEGVGASGWGRVDLMADSAGEPFLIEVNTVPGMTSHSLVPMAARNAGIDFDELVKRILQSSLERRTVHGRGDRR